MPSTKLSLCIGALLCVGFTLLFRHLFQTTVPVMTVRDNALFMSDFAYHLLLVREFWFGSLVNIYRYPEQLNAIQLVAPGMEHAMPVGMGILVLFLWYPFAVIARTDFELACALWSGLSLAVLCTAVVCFLSLLEGRTRICCFFVFLLTLCSNSAIAALLLGQTSVIMAGLFLLFLCRLQTEQFSRAAGAVLLLFACFKFPYLLIAAGVCCAYRKFGALWMFALIAACGCIFLTAIAGPELFIDFLASMQLYSSQPIPAYYADSIVPQTTNTLSTALRTFLDWTDARVVASIVLLLSQALLFWQTIARPEESRRPLAACLFFAAYLLFAPYAGAYEDLLYIPALAFALVYGNSQQTAAGRASLSLLRFCALCVILMLLFNHNLLPPTKPVILLWLLKPVPILLLLWQGQKARVVPT